MPLPILYHPSSGKNLFAIKFIRGPTAQVITIDELHQKNLKGEESDINYVYNGFSFVFINGMWYTQVQKEDTVFAFHGLASQSDIGAFSTLFTETAYGFNLLTDESLLNVTPEKIQVREVGSNITLKEALNNFGVPEDQLENLGVINGMDLNDSIAAGTKIKIVG